MIDWWWLVSNALWVSGCALALAAISYAGYAASIRGEKLRAVLRQADRVWPLYLAAVLFCAGLAATSSTWWEAAIWIGLTLYTLVQLVRQRRAKPS